MVVVFRAAGLLCCLLQGSRAESQQRGSARQLQVLPSGKSRTIGQKHRLWPASPASSIIRTENRKPDAQLGQKAPHAFDYTSERNALVHVFHDVRPVILVVAASAAFVLPMGLMLVAKFLGGAPAETPQSSSEETTTPPAVITWFTGIVCVGVMTNVTLIIPTAAVTARSAGQNITFSGLLMSSYVLGAFAGLAVFRHIPVESLRTAYLLHAFCMIFGNAAYSAAGWYDEPWLLIGGRMFVGCEGACMYNTAVAITHFARGSARTSYLVLYQFFVACGCLLGPVLAAVSMTVAEGISYSERLDVLANGVMCIWGAVLVIALLMFFPSDWSRLEEEAGLMSGGPSSSSASSSDSQRELTAESRSKGLAVLFILIGTGSMRMNQRLAWESGASLIFSETYGWGPSAAGFAVGSVVACLVPSQLAFSWYGAGKYSDATWMRTLELVQLIGVLFMFRLPEGSDARWRGMFILGSIISYCSNAIWGGVSTAYCLKRAIPNSVFDRQTLLLYNQVAIFLGMSFGGIISRTLLDLNPSQNALATELLLGSIVQFLLTYMVTETADEADANPQGT